MAEKPILFSGVMVRAILDGQKTQTRRIMNPQPFETSRRGEWCWVWSPKKGEEWFNWGDGFDCQMGNLSPYASFDNENYLWVREKHAIECPYGPAKGCDNPYHVIYWASEEEIVRDSITAKWRPSIFMPRWASRITQRVNEVRVERLQDIDEAGYFAEGIKDLGDGVGEFNHKRGMAEALFVELWDKINSSRGYGWAANPWVWVVDLR